MVELIKVVVDFSLNQTEEGIIMASQIELT